MNSGTLFRRETDPKTEALLGGIGYEDQLIADGFLSAAVTLSKSLRSDGLHPHTLVYPLAFSFRHYLELTLKHLLRILRSFAPLTDEQVVPVLGQHNIKDLFDLITAACQTVGDNSFIESADAKILATRIAEFHAKDPSSFAFRYARTKYGQRYIEPNTSFDLDTFSQKMEEVASILADVETWCNGLKIARVNSWADAVNQSLLAMVRTKDWNDSLNPRFVGGDVLQMQWTWEGTKKWVMGQLFEDKQIHMWFWYESRPQDYTEKLTTSDTDVDAQREAADSILSFLKPADRAAS